MSILVVCVDGSGWLWVVLPACPLQQHRQSDLWPTTPPSQHSHTLSPCGYVWARRLESSARLKVDSLHGVFFAYTGSPHAHRVQMWLYGALFCCVYDTFVKHKAPLCVWKAIHCVEIKHINPRCVLYSVSSMCDCSFGLQWSCQPRAPDHATLAQIRPTNRWSHHTRGSQATVPVCTPGNSFLSRPSACPPILLHPRPLTSFILGPLIILLMISFAFHLLNTFIFVVICGHMKFSAMFPISFFLIALGKLKLRYNKFISARLCLSTH